MAKVTTVVKAPLEIILINTLYFEIRKEWDNVLYGFVVYADSADKSYMRYSYSFPSPFPCTHRDFHLEQIVKRDYPEKGLVTLAVHSMPLSEECPLDPKKVRGTL
jgi:hypothetical protein